jgi:hypothetical protein
MTIETTAIKAVAQGNGATTVWPFTFLIPATDDVVLTLVDVASGNPTVIAPVNYTVSGAGSANGGTVTYPLSGSPVPSTYFVVVERALPLTQETDLQNQGAVYPEDIEDALDYLTMLTQQLQDQIDRAIVFSVADTVETTLPTAAARAGLFLGFDADGNPVAVDGLTAGTTVSAAMIPVVTAPTTSAALTALGLPGALLDLLIPAGTVWDYALTTAPTGFALMYGQPVTGSWPVLRAGLVAAGSPYGTNGVDPLMPDGRSFVLAGKSNMGGADNGLLTGGTVLGAVIGTQDRTLLLANLPPYTPAGTNSSAAGSATGNAGRLPVTDSGGITSSNAAGGALGQFTAVGAVAREALVVTNGAVTFAGTPQGGTSTAFKIVQPSLILNKIVKVH